MRIDFIKGVLVNLGGFILLYFFKTYSLFFLNLVVAIITSLRYYYEEKNKIYADELRCNYVFNINNICITTYALFQIAYYYPIISSLHSNIPLTRIPMIKAVPVIYVLMIYFFSIIMVLSINKYLSMKNNDTSQLIIIRVSAAITIIVIIIIIVNAAVYFIIHNYPLKLADDIFYGNFLKDPVNHYYRTAKPFSDCLWFSATTFFTVGYGDMHPVGNLMYLLSTLQMISAYILGIIMIPILLCRVTNLLYKDQRISR
jgi:hypothetical protein